MTLRSVILRREADEDVEAAFTWYEQQRAGLGAEFLLAVEAALAAIGRQPEIYPTVYKRARRLLLRRFPYGVFFVVQDDAVEVIACIHVRRNPRRWRARV